MIRWLIRRWAVRHDCVALVDGPAAIAQIALAISDARAEYESAGRPDHKETPHGRTTG